VECNIRGSGRTDKDAWTGKGAGERERERERKGDGGDDDDDDEICRVDAYENWESYFFFRLPCFSQMTVHEREQSTK
jgi:hypothetical protein